MPPVLRPSAPVIADADQGLQAQYSVTVAYTGGSGQEVGEIRDRPTGGAFGAVWTALTRAGGQFTGTVAKAAGVYDVEFRWTDASAGGIELDSPLVLSAATVAQGATLTGSVRYRNTSAAAITIAIIIAARPPGGTNAGPNRDLAPWSGFVTIPSGGVYRHTATRTLAPTDEPGMWYAFSTYQRQSDGVYVDADPGFNQGFTVTTAQGSGRNFYAAPTGSDAAAGTDPAAPLLTVQALLNKLTLPGDTGYLRGGIYQPAAPGVATDPCLSFTTNGTADAPITLRNYPGETPVIDGHSGASIVGPFNRRRGLRALSRSWLVVEGITFTRFGQVETDYAFSLESTTDVIVRDCHFTECWDSGLRQDHFSHRLTVVDCEGDGCTTALDLSGHTILIDGCTLHDNDRIQQNGEDSDGDDVFGEHGGQAIAIAGDFGLGRIAGPAEIRNCRAWNNWVSSISYGKDGAFVELFIGNGVVIHDNDADGCIVFVEAAGDTTGCRIYRNQIKNQQMLVTHQCNDLQFLHNTFYGSWRDYMGIYIGNGGAFGNGSSVNFKFIGNVIHFFGARLDGLGNGAIWQVMRAYDSGAEVNWNVYHISGTADTFGKWLGASNAALTNWRTASGKDANSVQLNPLLVSPATGDLTLQATSPAIDLVTLGAAGSFLAEIQAGYLGVRADAGYKEKA